MIPKIIHYCWFGPNAMPDMVLRCLSTWKKLCPEYTIKKWNESNAPSSAFLQKALEQKNWAKAADFVRLYALYSEGGIYLDTDVELLKPLDAFLLDACFLGFQENYISKDCVNNAVMGAHKEHAFVQEALTCLEQDFDGTEATFLSGPNLVTKILLKRGLKEFTNRTVVVDDVVIYPPRFFYPYFWGEPFNKKCVQKDTHAIHHWSLSWISETSGPQAAPSIGCMRWLKRRYFTRKWARKQGDGFNG